MFLGDKEMKKEIKEILEIKKENKTTKKKLNEKVNEKLIKKNKRRKRMEIAFNFVIAGLLVYALVFYVIYSKKLDKYLIPALLSCLFYFTVIFFSFTLHQLCKDLDIKKRTFIYLAFYFTIMLILTPITIFSLLAGYFMSDDDFFEKIRIKNEK